MEVEMEVKEKEKGEAEEVGRIERTGRRTQRRRSSPSRWDSWAPLGSGCLWRIKRRR